MGSKTALALLAAASVLTAAAPASRAGDPFLRRTAAVEVVEKVGPAVVNITTETLVAAQSPFRSFFGRDPVFERFFQDFFEPRAPRSVQSLGSGVLFDRDRHVLTNEHVVAQASRIRVSLSDQREFDAVLVGADPNNDLAVLRVETDEPLPWVKPGRSSDLMVGEPVIAIGNPFGLSNTVTTGVISALDRSIRTGGRSYHGFLQTDASINPGNSGGPLLNADGELVGINTAIYGGGAQGIGFAIPVDAAARVVRELIAHGEVAPVWLGLELQDVDDGLRRALQLPDGLTGALVSEVHGGSSGTAAGLVRGDLVVRVDGHLVRSARELYDMLGRAVAGQTLRLEVWRDGESREVSADAEVIPDAVLPELATRLLGVKLREAPNGGYEVVSVRPGSGPDRVGIQSGDLLININGRPLEGKAELRRSLLDLRGRARARLVVQRGRGRYPVLIPLG